MIHEDELRQGGIAEGLLGRVGLRSLVRMWFNPATGHFVADAIGCFMWSETVAGPWRIVPNSTPAGRLALNRSGEKP